MYHQHLICHTQYGGFLFTGICIRASSEKTGLIISNGKRVDQDGLSTASSVLTVSA